MFTSEDITKFEAFDNYNFDKDERFQLGISSLLNNKQDNEVELVERAKIFYYTKFIENFDIEEYKTWKKGSQETMMKGKDMNEKVENSATRFTFQEIVDMIEKGIEIPGIKQIPNVLNEGTPSESKMLARPKPWEMKK